MSNRSEMFGRLLKGAINSIATYEGKTAPIIEEELGTKIGLASTSLQRYKAGYLPPDPRTVEIIAEAAVQRAYLHREWLQRFLHAARYHQTAQLLDRLCPTTPARPRPQRVYQNLPAPTYSQFVMREEAFAEVLDGLSQRSAAVIVVGLGGNGKTSLAREVADRCIKKDDGSALFDAAIWISDKDRPGTTNLSTVLDEIARTLDYPGFTQFEHDEKCREVEQLLRRQRVLVCVDNVETITDAALLAWLLKLPEPSKTLITTREYRREFRRGGWPVELRGMRDTEARELVDERLKVLRIEKLVSGKGQLEPLVVATGGNPKAIEITLGLVKYERRPLDQVVDDLYAARGELFNDLFTRAWALLDEAARRVLLVMTFFPATASAEALSATADVEGYAFDHAVERLADLALLDVQQADLNSMPRYTVHPLVRAFAGAQISAQEHALRAAQNRWFQYFCNMVTERGKEGLETADDLEQFEQDIENIHAVLRYCYAEQHWVMLIHLVSVVGQFWSIRGYYQVRNTFVEQALSAAEISGDVEAQISLLSTKVRSSCYEDDLESAMRYHERARTLLVSLDRPATGLITGINYAEIRICTLRGDLEKMRTLIEQNLAITNSPHWSMLYRFDKAYYLYQAQQYDEAEQLLKPLIPASGSPQGL
jgi:hypothetical protein